MAEVQEPANPQKTAKKPASTSEIGDVEKFHVKIQAPFKTYYDDYAKSVSAVNKAGPFDILPMHHNFITLLIACDIVVRPQRGDEIRFRISQGVMLVKAHQLVVFLNV